jgi:3-phosphoshikimate 1-carboxyvinyltransferase
MSNVVVSHPTGVVDGIISISGSKSISNRVLLIRALSGQSFEIGNLSNSDDTVTMQKLLSQSDHVYDAHHAGTTFRFMTALLSLTTKREVILTGSERMQQRPIKALVDALNEIGADVHYQNHEGYPPLVIRPSHSVWKSEITLPADISSQYISALLMIAPYLPQGLKLHLEGEIVSRPYIEMTLELMKNFGVVSHWEGQTIEVSSGMYTPQDFYVEADWSSASYFYSIAALAKTARIEIHGLDRVSLQGDHVVAQIFESLGVHTAYGDHVATLTKVDASDTPLLEYDFVKCPDLVQTVAVAVAGKGWMGLYSGLQTLHIKETDRVEALKNELTKVFVFLSKLPDRFYKKNKTLMYSQEGQASAAEIPTIVTYNDHRMAMCFAPLALQFPVEIADAKVVSKSYPQFWKDLTSLGFEVKSLS